MTEPILAAYPWKSNAELIEACAKLGYIGSNVLDPTWGRGTWWKNYTPESLTLADRILDEDYDFTLMPWDANTFDTVAFDPPYVSAGGRETTTLGEYHNRYGMDKAKKTPKQVQHVINVGLAECTRVVKTRGFVLVKCQDYISSGKFWNGTYLTQRFAIEILRLEQVDRLDMITNPRPQPAERNGIVSAQQHARRNLSTMFVFRKVMS